MIDRYGQELLIGEFGSEEFQARVISSSLETVNDLRTAMAIGEGKLDTLPTGIPGEPRHCVVAKALSNGWNPNVNGDNISLNHPGKDSVNVEALKSALTKQGFKIRKTYNNLKDGVTVEIYTPEDLEVLIEMFDAGEIPSLVSDEQTAEGESGEDL